MGPGRFSLNLRVSKTIGFGPETKSAGDVRGTGGGGRARRRAADAGRAADLAGPRAVRSAWASATSRRYSLTFSVNARNIFQQHQLRAAGGQPQFANFRTAELYCWRTVWVVVGTPQDRIAGYVQLLATSSLMCEYDSNGLAAAQKLRRRTDRLGVALAECAVIPSVGTLQQGCPKPNPSLNSACTKEADSGAFVRKPESPDA